jgi:glycosyltransferase involved in cell wall biosynthesis
MDRPQDARRRIALVRQGDRPRLNTHLAAMLGDLFPEHAVDDLDVLQLVRRRRARFVGVAVAGLAENAWRLARRTISAKQAIITSAAFERAVQRELARRVSAATHAFTFQSQSLFSAAVPGVPHFVYTDHAHLANLAYPGFDRRALAGRRFVGRERRGYHAACRVFVRSQHVRDVLVSTYGVPPQHVVDVGVGPNVHVTAHDAAWHDGRIVFVGVDWERKGGPVLLEAFRRLHAERPTSRLEIVGCSPPIPETPGVTVHGRLPEGQVAALLAECDVFCLPTRAEPFGVAFIEAMHAGLPVVGTRLGAVPDFVGDGSTGRLVEPDDTDGLHAALRALVDDPQAAQAMGAAGRALARQRYDWPVVMDAIRREVAAGLDEHARMMRAHPLRLAALIVGMRIDGGAESLVRTLLYELKDTPCDTTVFTLRDIDPQSRAQIEQFGAHVVELPGRKLISPRRFARMVRALRAGRYDVIHTHLTGANLLGLLCGALLRIPVVVSLHSVRSSGDDHWYHGRLERQLIRRVASRVIAVGDETATARAAVLGDDVDIHVLPNAVTPQPVPSTSKRDQLRREVMTDTAGPLFLCVGRLTRAKAHAVLIDAFQHVRERLPDAELALAGDGRLRDELRGLTADLGLSDVVHFLGRRSDARDLIAAADVFVMSSVWEGLPMALLEAMQAETPIVATDVGDIAEVLQGTPSRVVAPGDADALADAMVATVDDIRAGLDLTTAGAFVVSERYSSATWADRVLDHYYSVASYRLAKGGDRYLAESA